VAFLKGFLELKFLMYSVTQVKNMVAFATACLTVKKKREASTVTIIRTSSNSHCISQRNCKNTTNAPIISSHSIGNTPLCPQNSSLHDVKGVSQSLLSTQAAASGVLYAITESNNKAQKAGKTYLLIKANFICNLIFNKI